ncbi:MAG TPA: hypothetical protein VHG71_11785 [Verrucomicrobiae bacterium]|nr:hypothetical protein [Verrucomicrobiae bacterium]
MKPFSHLALSVSAGLLAFAAVNANLQAADTKNSSKTTTLEIPKSVFAIPSSPKDGRDPFFPNSTRLYEAAVIKTTQSTAIASLTLKGISGEADHRYVIINNHTFAAGDEGDVISSGVKIHLRCIEIKQNSAVIEADGRRSELFLAN